MGNSCSMHGRDEKCAQNVTWKNQGSSLSTCYLEPPPKSKHRQNHAWMTKVKIFNVKSQLICGWYILSVSHVARVVFIAFFYDATKLQTVLSPHYGRKTRAGSRNSITITCISQMSSLYVTILHTSLTVIFIYYCSKSCSCKNRPCVSFVSQNV
jgi:hypothetical protein